MSVKDFDLWHSLDDLQTIVRLLCQWITEKVQLLQESKLLKELKENVEITKLVITDQEHLQEFKSSDSFNVRKLIVLAVDFLNSKVRRNII